MTTEQVDQVDIGLAEPVKTPSRPRRKLNLKRWAFFLVLAAAAYGADRWWMNEQRFESTDDAQVEGHLDLVSSRISGTVLSINPKVENNRFVEAGTLLMELDPRDYAAELEHAKANLDTAGRRSARGAGGGSHRTDANAPSANCIPPRRSGSKPCRPWMRRSLAWWKPSTNCSAMRPSRRAPSATASDTRRSSRSVRSRVPITTRVKRKPLPPLRPWKATAPR